jgi:hypothetical protein
MKSFTYVFGLMLPGIFFAEPCFSSDVIVTGGAPSHYAGNAQTLQKELQNDKKLASEGKLGETAILADSAYMHGDTIGATNTVKQPNSAVSANPGLGSATSTSSPASSAEQVGGVRYWGGQDGYDYFELYGQFANAQDITFNCSNGGQPDGYAVTYSDNKQINVKVPTAAVGQICWVGTKTSPDQQLIQILPLADHVSAATGGYYVSGVLQDSAGKPISNATVEIRFNYELGGGYVPLKVVTDSQGRYVIPGTVASISGFNGGGGSYQLVALDSAGNQIAGISISELRAFVSPGSANTFTADSFVYIGNALKASTTQP